MDALHSLCWALGLYCISRLIWRFGGLLWLYWGPAQSLAAAYGKSSWAVVTGASSGIGEALACKLAKDGFSLLLVARSNDRLEALAIRLREAWQVAVEVLPLDLAQSDSWRSVELVMRGRKWSMLVNNAGALDFREFAHLSAEEAEASLRLHIGALVALTQFFLASGSERKALINLGSLSGTVPLPSLALYSGSKAFISAFSEVLAKENSADVLCVAPVCVSSGMTWGLGLEGPDSVAAAILRCVGRTDWSAGSLRQEILHYAAEMLPRSAVQALFRSISKVVQLVSR